MRMLPPPPVSAATLDCFSHRWFGNDLSGAKVRTAHSTPKPEVRVIAWGQFSEVDFRGSKRAKDDTRDSL